MAADHFQKWRTWLERIEAEQIRALIIHHSIFERFRARVKPLQGTTHLTEFVEWTARGQIAFICMAIRRATAKKPKNDDSISLRRLLDEIAQTRLLSPHADVFSTLMVDADLKDIESCRDLIKGVTDKIIAHTDENQTSVVPPTYEQLDKGVHLLTTLFARYYREIVGSAYLLPPLDEQNLEAVFSRIFDARQ